MKGMILAAGLGTRFRPHSQTMAKPAFPFLNVPFLYYSIFLADSIKTDSLVVNTHHCPHSIAQLCQRSPPFKGKIHLSHEEQILGNAGGLLKAQAFLDSRTFLVLNADTVVLPSDHDDLCKAKDLHASEERLCTLMLMPHPQAGREYGAVWLDREDNVVAFGKTKPHKDTRPFHFFGVRFFSQDLFAYIPKGPCDIFRDVLPRAIQSGERVKGHVIQARFFDGGNLSNYLRDSLTALQILPQNPFLLRTLETFCPGFHFSKTADSYQLFAPKSQVDASLQSKGFVIAGADSRIGADCRLENVVLDSGYQLEQGAQLKNQLLLCP